MAVVGATCLKLALLVCAYGIGASLYGATTGRREWIRSGRRAMFSVAGLTLVASNDDVDESQSTSRVCFTAAASTTYLIAVDGYAGDTGAVTLTYGPRRRARSCCGCSCSRCGRAWPSC